MKAPLTSVPAYLESGFAYRLFCYVEAPCLERHALAEDAESISLSS